MSLLNRIRFTPYRIARRIGTADISRVFGIESRNLQASPLSKGSCLSEISSADHSHLLRDHPELFYPDQVHELALDNVYCFVLRRADALAAFAWLATGEVAAEFNHNGDLRAGLPISLPPDTGFLYNVFVVTKHRGQRLYGSIVRELTQRMQDRGVTRLILTTDASNISSLKALHRMGFQDLGTAWLVRIGPFSMARYPISPVFGSVKFGKYAGDRTFL